MYLVQSVGRVEGSASFQGVYLYDSGVYMFFKRVPLYTNEDGVFLQLVCVYSVAYNSSICEFTSCLSLIRCRGDGDSVRGTGRGSDCHHLWLWLQAHLHCTFVLLSTDFTCSQLITFTRE